MPTTTPLDRAAAALTEALAEVKTEITSYPAPIAGCDAQFNALLDTRRRLERALEELNRPEFIPTPRQPA
ncbi:hypothetical protein [Maliponia aquimaris]|uniref:Uncharacterized protein n=1 Tax=Maliponia aquimaris TaxID=1673631 RepID=A0A238K271_9RHOB|nr:hypothetical protein [Maliponia aquimaris]SMX36873.1 hypothetical protein MAA8898_01088 [Maliponia aquimaris]